MICFLICAHLKRFVYKELSDEQNLYIEKIEEKEEDRVSDDIMPIDAINDNVASQRSSSKGEVGEMQFKWLIT